MEVKVIGRLDRSKTGPPSNDSSCAICMLIAVGATNRRLAAATALPASTTSQKYRSCLKFIFSECKTNFRRLIQPTLYSKLHATHMELCNDRCLNPREKSSRRSSRPQHSRNLGRARLLQTAW
ncbi:hypothetical protein CBM2599_B50415 [Cupriavidus taiwanensis]|nr:hypothetical protein CBM2600_B10578 [Cupriavidus taiwanensis]SOY96483.1 hypothetical protein CBM2599_B50415 [Cupriavidus taiwanensis]